MCRMLNLVVKVEGTRRPNDWGEYRVGFSVDKVNLLPSQYTRVESPVWSASHISNKGNRRVMNEIPCNINVCHILKTALTCSILALRWTKDVRTADSADDFHFATATKFVQSIQWDDRFRLRTLTNHCQCRSRYDTTFGKHWNVRHKPADALSFQRCRQSRRFRRVPKGKTYGHRQ